MHFHQKILKYLLDYREEYNPDFNFLVRQRTDVNDKKFPGGKFAHGLVLQGTNNYCFVALSDKSGGANATKSIGIVISPTKKNSFNAKLEIVFPGETNLELIAFYKDLATKFEGINWDKHELRAWLHIGEFPEDDPTLLYRWLDDNFPIIRETALQSGIKKLIPDDVRFNSLQEKLKVKLQEAKESKVAFASKNAISIRERFSDWLKGNESSNKINSYLRAIDILNEILDKDIYLEKNIAQLTILYRDLIDHQRDQKGKYFYEAAPSYGNNGFYSASVKAFIDFLKEGHGIVPKKDEPIENEMEKATNQILYGPPGTGKTFYLKEQLFDKYTLKEEAISKEKYFEEVVSNITWWQAITLALIEDGKSKVSSILENRWVATKANLSESKNVRATIWGALQMHTIEESKSVNYKQRQAPLIFDKVMDKSWVLLEAELKEQSPEIYKILDEVNNFEANTGKSIKHYDFVTFHQSFAYEDFIEGIKPVMPENEEETKDLGYRIEDGVFKKLCFRAKNDPENRYAIFIDEINRGNVSAIFGELITLIETDKRMGTDNALSIKLPYSKKEFSVPANVDIYGTMNTADRSVEALDTALRRRFEFKEMMPKPVLLKDIAFGSFNLETVLETINNRIAVLLDRDYVIGHSYFINLKSNDSLGLAEVFSNKVLPLLQEYFYNDYEKIALVLGAGFVKEEKNKEVQFPVFTEIDKPESLTTYTLKSVDENSIIAALEQLLLISA